MQRLFDVKKTQIQMVEDRGFVIPPDEIGLLKGTLKDFQRHITAIKANSDGPLAARQCLTRQYFSPDERESMFLFYGYKSDPSTKQISVSEITTFSDFVNGIIAAGQSSNTTLKYAVIIVDYPISAQANKNLKALESVVRCQMFYDHEICYNPTHHILVPIHIKLSEEEKQAKMRELMVDSNKIPLMLPSDPIARYYGWSSGDMIKIIRTDTELSMLAPKSVNYRIITS